MTVTGAGRARHRTRAARGPRALAVAPYLLIIVGWIGLTVGNRWYVNPDGVVYAALAERIGDGDLSDAVTGYWSPLLTVLAAPFTVVGLSGLWALRVALLFVALGAVPVLRDLCVRACDDEMAADVAMLAGVPLLATAAVFGLYPDLVLALALLLFCRAVLVGRTVGDAALAGVWGGLAYLAKPVGLPFVVAFVVIVGAVRLYAGPGRAGLVRAAAVTLVVTGLVALPWIVTISIQAGQPTISTAGEFNNRLVAPGVWGNPLSFPGLYPPEKPVAVTPWEDPSDLPVQRNEGFVGAPVTLLDRAENVYDQGRLVIGTGVRRWLPVAVLAVAGVVVALRAGGRSRRIVLGALLGSALLAGGMSLIVIVERYLWFSQLALLPAAAVALRVLFERWSRAVATAVAAGALVLVTVAQAPVALAHWQGDREVWALADTLEGRAPLTGPVAGTGDWQRSQLLAHLAGEDYVGLIDNSADAPDPAVVVEGLRAAGVAHLVVWPDPDPFRAAPDLPPVTVPTVLDVTPDGLVPHA